MIYEQKSREETVRKVAEAMMAAARTAPKAKGKDNLEIALLDKKEIKTVSDRMKEIGSRPGMTKGFIRDAENILLADSMIILGTRIQSMGLAYCSLCGYSGCDEKNEHPDHPCAFNTGDLGIAVGSAVSKAMDARIDNRVMYTVGMATKELKLLGEEIKVIYGIPLSCSSKNVFFDRQ